MKPNWTPIKIKLGQIIAWEHNPRMSNKAQAQRLIESEKHWGQPMTFAVSPFENGMVFLYDGHQRYSAWLTVYGSDYEVDARQCDRFLTEEERLEFVVTMHAGATGSWDWQKLSSFPAPKLIEMGFDEALKKQYDFDANNIKELLNSEQVEPVDAEPQIDRAAELAEKWHTATGQLWKLGEHRLLIGDCTVRENVERLMGGERADMVFTDPPYNVGKNYAGEDLSAEEFEKFHSAWMSEMEKIISPDTPVYACFGAKWLFEFTDIFRRIIKKPRLLVWYKPDSHGVGGGDYFYNYEAILYGSVSGAFSVRSYEGEARDVWIINKAKESDGGFEHSTVKPIEVPTAALLTSSKVGWVIYEPFCGSGSTLLAAHNLNRRCYAMEISPNYGGVILERFYTATGITPELVTE